ncbi:MAG: hypothetical protein L0Y58_13925 [Verrucomicrobia subdivision 3 bacterium]|nr:hypothetical protein [Limisphaerales bacterium]
MPSLQEVLAYAERAGLAPWRATDWFHEMEGCGWLDYKHRPIVKWRSVLDRLRVKWEADGRPCNRQHRLPPRPGGGRPAGGRDREDRQERKGA